MALNQEQVEAYAKHLDYHVRSLGDLTEVMQEIRLAVESDRLTQQNIYSEKLERIERWMENVSHQLEIIGIPKIDSYEMQMKTIKNKLEGEWPVAIDPDFVHVDPELLAENVIHMVVMDNLQGVNFLDYQCNSGHIVQEAARQGANISVGYDKNQKWEFPDQGNIFYTSDFGEIQKKGPYDIVLLYDVLDHTENPEDVLMNVKQVLSPKGRVYLRCHPWCSKHGGHLHEKINKAYLHLILDETELTRLGGYSIRETNKIYKPLQTYRKWFEKSGFKIQQELPLEEEPEDFFLQDPVIMDRLQQHWSNDTIKPYISINFVDYVLEAEVANHKVF